MNALEGLTKSYQNEKMWTEGIGSKSERAPIALVTTVALVAIVVGALAFTPALTLSRGVAGVMIAMGTIGLVIIAAPYPNAKLKEYRMWNDYGKDGNTYRHSLVDLGKEKSNQNLFVRWRDKIYNGKEVIPIVESAGNLTTYFKICGRKSLEAFHNGNSLGFPISVNESTITDVNFDILNEMFNGVVAP